MNAREKAKQLRRAVLRIAAEHQDTGFDAEKTAPRQQQSVELPPEAVTPGDRVLIVGAGGDFARQAMQQAGQQGSTLVIEDELELCERFRAEMAGGRKAREIGDWYLEQTDLDDLRTDPQLLEATLSAQPVGSLAAFRRFEHDLAMQRQEAPLVGDASFDAVLLDLAINRLPEERVATLLSECFRSLCRGGRLVVGALLSDEALEPLPELRFAGVDLRCILGETRILEYLDAAGFYGMGFAERRPMPAKVIGGTELRFHVLMAFKGKQGTCLDRGQAVVYRGPWRRVFDDDDHCYQRGERTAVCEKTYRLLQQAPYAGQFFALPPYREVPEHDAMLFDCDTPLLRDPRVTKGLVSPSETRREAASPNTACNTEDGCC